MIWYSVQPRDRIFIKGYGFLFFARNMAKNVDKRISKILTSKYSQKRNHTKILIQMFLKLLQEKRIKYQQTQLVI